jgi:hypothetical protein
VIWSEPPVFAVMTRGWTVQDGRIPRQSDVADRTVSIRAVAVPPRADPIPSVVRLGQVDPTNRRPCAGYGLPLASSKVLEIIDHHDD